jgi:ATP-dependent DNA helicase RecG
MVRTNDGFEIAEVDLQLRGPGDLSGTQQSGLLDLKIADLAKDQVMLSAARELALEILDEDPNMEQSKNRIIVETVKKIKQKKTDWSNIS